MLIGVVASPAQYWQQDSTVAPRHGGSRAAPVSARQRYRSRLDRTRVIYTYAIWQPSAARHGKSLVCEVHGVR